MAKRFRLPDTPLLRSSGAGNASTILPHPTPETWSDLVNVLDLAVDTVHLAGELRGRLEDDHVADRLFFDGWMRAREVCHALQTGTWRDFTKYDYPEDKRREMLMQAVDAVDESVTGRVLQNVLFELMKGKGGGSGNA